MHKICSCFKLLHCIFWWKQNFCVTWHQHMPVSINFFCHRDISSIKFQIFIRWFNIIKLIDELFWWKKFAKQPTFSAVDTDNYFSLNFNKETFTVQCFVIPETPSSYCLQVVPLDVNFSTCSWKSNFFFLFVKFSFGIGLLDIIHNCLYKTATRKS